MRKIRNSEAPLSPKGAYIRRMIKCVEILTYLSCTPLLGVGGLFLCLFLNSCQEPTLACLDVKATNFDVTASGPCTTGCCTYPNLKVQADYLWGTDKFSLNKKYLFGTDSITFLSAQMYLSDFQLITSDNKTASAIDSATLYRTKDTIKTLNNFVLVGKNVGFEFSMGQFNQPTKYAKVKFQVGLNNTLITAVPSKMPSSSPLSIKADSMYLTASNTYIFNKMVIARKNTKDTLKLFITTPTAMEITKNLSFTEGFDAAIPLKINYLQFLNGVDFSKSQSVIQQKIMDNTTTAISF
jgi:hypothetical protein